MTEDRTVVERLDRARDVLDEYMEAANLQDHQELQMVHEALWSVRRDLDEIIENDVADCVHCGSPLTFRRSDGDIGCKDCPGIMPRNGEVDR